MILITERETGGSALSWVFDDSTKPSRESLTKAIAEAKTCSLDNWRTAKDNAFTPPEQEALSGKLRTVTGERDLARTELEHTKNDLERAWMRMAQMEPHVAMARQLAIHIGFRKALLGSGYVLMLQNKTTKPMSLNVTVTDATGQKTKPFRVVANGGTTIGANFQAANPAEIGHQEGWAFGSGDKVEVFCPGFDPIKITAP